MNKMDKMIFIEERYGKDKVATFLASGLCEERLNNWRILLNGRKDGIFEKRLEGEGLKLEDAKNICGEHSIEEPLALKARVQPVYEAIANYVGVSFEKMGMSKLEALAGISSKDIEKEGPLGALLPFICTGKRRLDRSFQKNGLLTESAQKDLLMILLYRLCLICSRMFNQKMQFLVLRGKVPGVKDAKASWQVLEKELLEDGWQEVLEEFPVLTRLIGTTLENYCTFIEEFLERLNNDQNNIIKDFFPEGNLNPIVHMTGEISDMHQNGKCVLIMEFFGGNKLVYKPHSLKIDQGWETFTKEFLQKAAKLKAPHVLDRDTYGFIEYIENEPCKSKAELEAYYHSAGALMAVIHAFGGNDFHKENLIANGSYPVIIDTETLMKPEVLPFANTASDSERNQNLHPLEKAIDESVLNVGFLPLWQINEENKREDCGALTALDEIQKNAPIFNGKRYSGGEFKAHILQGFQEMYEYLKASKEYLVRGDGLSVFKDCYFRMLIRTSQTYANLIKVLLSSANLKDGFTYSMKAERLVNAFLYDARRDAVPGLIKVFLSEKKAVERGDVPIFYAQPYGGGILDEKELLFSQYFSKSPLERAKERIDSFSKEDKNIQMKIIEASLCVENRDTHEYMAQLTGNGEEPEKTILEGEDLLKEAEVIYQSLMEHRFTAGSQYSWLAEQYDMVKAGSCLNLMGPALYDGLSGIGLFMGALYRVTGKNIYMDSLEQVLIQVNRFVELLTDSMSQYMQPGYSNGVSGVLTSLGMIGEMTGSKAAKAMIKKLFFAITPQKILQSEEYDLFSGTAGIIFALEKWKGWKENESSRVHGYKILEACAEHLIKKSVKNEEGILIWNSKHSTKSLTGMGHGASGISLAFIILYKETGKKEYLNIALETTKYENLAFCKKEENWMDFRTDSKGRQTAKKQFMVGYCSGAPGIGLARSKGLSLLKQSCDFNETEKELIAIYENDVKRATSFTINMRAELRNHLCCGSAGRIEFLLQEGRESIARQRISSVVKGKQRRGFYNLHADSGMFYYNPGFFQGECGIGYEILRVIAKDKVPSVLI